MNMSSSLLGFSLLQTPCLNGDSLQLMKNIDIYCCLPKKYVSMSNFHSEFQSSQNNTQFGGTSVAQKLSFNVVFFCVIGMHLGERQFSEETTLQS